MTNKNDKGFSLVELMVSAAVASALLYFSSSFLSQPKDLFEEVKFRNDSRMDRGYFMKNLQTHLSRTFILKNGIIKCVDDPRNLTSKLDRYEGRDISITNETENFAYIYSAKDTLATFESGDVENFILLSRRITAEQQQLEIYELQNAQAAAAGATSFSSIEPVGTEEMDRVVDAIADLQSMIDRFGLDAADSKLKILNKGDLLEGDVIYLQSLHNPGIGGIYHIADLTDGDKTIALNRIDTPQFNTGLGLLDMDCEVDNAKNLSLVDIIKASASSAVSFSGVVRIHKLEMLNLKFEKDPAHNVDLHGFIVYDLTYNRLRFKPSIPGFILEENVRVLSKGIDSVTISESWYPSQGTSATDSNVGADSLMSGRFFADIYSQNRTKNAKNVYRKDGWTREKFKASYNIDLSSRSNFSVVTTARPAYPVATRGSVRAIGPFQGRVCPDTGTGPDNDNQITDTEVEDCDRSAILYEEYILFTGLVGGEPSGTSFTLRSKGFDCIMPTEGNTALTDGLPAYRQGSNSESNHLFYQDPTDASHTLVCRVNRHDFLPDGVTPHPERGRLVARENPPVINYPIGDKVSGDNTVEWEIRPHFVMSYYDPAAGDVVNKEIEQSDVNPIKLYNYGEESEFSIIPSCSLITGRINFGTFSPPALGVAPQIYLRSDSCNYLPNTAGAGAGGPWGECDPNHAGVLAGTSQLRRVRLYPGRINYKNSEISGAGTLSKANADAPLVVTCN